MPAPKRKTVYVTLSVKLIAKVRRFQATSMRRTLSDTCEVLITDGLAFNRKAKK